MEVLLYQMDIMVRKQSSRFQKPELLAPAGDLMRAKTAIRFGADAVYLGGQSYSLRSRASNFSMNDIQEICEFAKAYGANIHVTVNIIPHEEDFEGLKEYLMKLEEYGVTAIITASVAIMKLAKQVAPKLEVHCSTQMSITNVEAAKFLVNTNHIDRVVLARECNIDDVYEIVEKCPVETEAFIHGGMCVNYSGRCTLSNRMTLRDANRGGCAQSCRWSYHLYDAEQEISDPLLFTMGSKDLCAAEYLYDLMNAGVSSLKIEGRMKTEYYVACIVSSYRHLIDAIYANGGPLSEAQFEALRKEIMRGENRQTWSGFYGNPGNVDSIIYHATSDVDVNHDFLGKVISYDAQEQAITMYSRNYFEKGETLEVLSSVHGTKQFTCDWIQNEKGELIEKSNHPMDLVKLPVPFEVSADDLIRRAR